MSHAWAIGWALLFLASTAAPAAEEVDAFDVGLTLPLQAWGELRLFLKP